MAVVSDDHADETMNVEGMGLGITSDENGRSAPRPRLISQEEVNEHSGPEGSFWAVVDSFVIDATQFVEKHPGGMRKLLGVNSASEGVTGRPFGFSFTRGRNAHFPDTGRRFHEGVTRYLAAGGDGPFLSPAEVAFPPYGNVVILGRLGKSEQAAAGSDGRSVSSSQHSALLSASGVGFAAGAGACLIFLAVSRLGSRQRGQQSRFVVK